VRLVLVGDSPEHRIGAGRIHTQTITIWLWFVKRDIARF
jgi:hypothetical protein